MTQDNQLRLLAVLAHPDDESFGMGGTLALFAQQNVEVHLICATRGEVGDVDPDLLQGYDNVAKLREDELRCAVSILGLKEVHFLGYRDSGMPGAPENRHPEALASAPLDEVAAQVASLIRQIRPQVVVTFDPYGGYGHPDHIVIQRACTEAFHAAGIPDQVPDGLPPYRPQKLYYHTFPRRMMRFLVRLMPILGQNPREFGRNRDIDLVAIAAHAFPIHVKVNIRPVADIKARASACHSSQTTLSDGGLVRSFFRLIGGTETYMRAYPPATGNLREQNLFEGVKTDSRE